MSPPSDKTAYARDASGRGPVARAFFGGGSSPQQPRLDTFFTISGYTGGSHRPGAFDSPEGRRHLKRIALVQDLAREPLRFSPRSHDPALTQGLAAFAPCSLEDLGSLTLLRRTDTKYVLSSRQLSPLLAALRADYALLEIDGVRAHPYRTLYWDTPDLALYQMHHNGRRKRYKVRCRSYLATGQSFLEVKLHTRRRTTEKVRRELARPLTELTPSARLFIERQLAGQFSALPELVPTLGNDFWRITLVSQRHQERLTLDLGLRLWGEQGALELSRIVIVEIKQARQRRDTPSIQQMRAWGVRPTSLSKYCIGISLLWPEVRHNRFHRQLRLIQQRNGGELHVEWIR